MSEYSDKLRLPQWQRKRLEIMERDGFACRSCEARDKPLNVHHLFYERARDPWDYPNQSLITYCEECHSYEHELRVAAERDFVSAFRRIGASSFDLGAFEEALMYSLGVAGSPTLPRQITTQEWFWIAQAVATLVRHGHHGGDIKALAGELEQRVVPRNPFEP
jgi:hypothetical protein